MTALVSTRSVFDDDRGAVNDRLICICFPNIYALKNTLTGVDEVSDLRTQQQHALVYWADICSYFTTNIMPTFEGHIYSVTFTAAGPP